MDAKSAIQETFNVSTMVMTSYLSDLDDTELMNRPGPGCQHVAWQLGHLIVAENQLLNMVCPGKGVELPAGFAEQHNKDAANSDERRLFATKEEYLALFAQSEAAIKAALSELSAEDLDAPSPEGLRNMFPTVGHVFILLGTHRLMHAGQWVPIRRALNKPVVI